MKYDRKFKLRCIKKYKNGEYIEDLSGMRHNSFYKQVRKWMRILDSLGEVELENGRPTLDI